MPNYSFFIPAAFGLAACLAVAMYEIEVSFEISAAHALRGYDGPCANTHGHNWLITLYAVGRDVDADGFCLDFKVLKQVGKLISARIDHQNLNSIEPFTTVNPTAENLARWLYEESQRLLKECLGGDEAGVGTDAAAVNISRVRVQETSRCAVTYTPTTTV